MHYIFKKMDFTLFYYLFCYIFISIFSIISLFYSGSGIYFLHKTKQKSVNSPMIKIFFFYNFLWSFFSTINNFYMAIFWRPDTVIYNAYFMYFLASICTMLLMLNPVIELFYVLIAVFLLLFQNCIY